MRKKNNIFLLELEIEGTSYHLTRSYDTAVSIRPAASCCKIRLGFGINMIYRKEGSSNHRNKTLLASFSLRSFSVCHLHFTSFLLSLSRGIKNSGKNQVNDQRRGRRRRGGLGGGESMRGRYRDEVRQRNQI